MDFFKCGVLATLFSLCRGDKEAKGDPLYKIDKPGDQLGKPRDKISKIPFVLHTSGTSLGVSLSLDLYIGCNVLKLRLKA